MQLLPRILLVKMTLLALTMSSQSTLIDSLEKTLPILSEREKITVLGDLSWEYSTIDANKAREYAEQMLQLSEQLKDSVLIADAANMMTVALYRQGHYEDALKQNRRAYRIRRASGNPRAIGSSINKFVNIYIDQVRLDSAMKYALETVKIYEELKDTANQSIAYNTVSSIFQKDRNWQECKVYAERAYQLAGLVNFDYGKGGAAGNIAGYYESIGDFQKAIEWYEIARSAFEKVNSQVDLATVALNLGVIYRKTDQPEKALERYMQSLEMSKATGEGQGIAHAAANIGALQNMKKNYTEAIDFFQRALPIAESEQMGRTLLLCYNGLSEAYSMMGNGAEAVRFMKRYIDLRDTLYRTDQQEALSEMQTQFETEKKEQENDFLKKENELKEKEKKQVIIGSSLLIFLLILAGYFAYHSYRKRQQSAHQAALLQEKERGLEAVFLATEEERIRIARELHDGVGQQLSGLKMSWEGLLIRQSEEKGILEKLTLVLDDACREVRSISHQMMPKVLMEAGLIPALEDMLSKSLGLSRIVYRLEHFNMIQHRFDQRVELGLFRITQELVSNIIKHSEATEVVLQLYLNKKILILIVEDNGRGFSSNEKSEGIGLMNIVSRVGTIKGDISWEKGTLSGQGTVVTVRVPVLESNYI